MNRGFCKIIRPDILHRFCARNLACGKILHKKSLFRIAPQRAVIVIAGADGIDLDVPVNKLKRKALRKSDAAELSAGIGEIRL